MVAVMYFRVSIYFSYPICAVAKIHVESLFRYDGRWTSQLPPKTHSRRFSCTQLVSLISSIIGLQRFGIARITNVQEVSLGQGLHYELHTIWSHNTVF